MRTSVMKSSKDGNPLVQGYLQSAPLISKLRQYTSQGFSRNHVFMCLMTKLNYLSGFFMLIVAGLLIWIHIRLYSYAFDDAYIHLRVARNLVETGFPYYNTNEMVKVSTSSGWTIWLAMLFGFARLIRMEDNLPLILGVLNAGISLCGMMVFTAVVESLLKARLSLSSKLLFQLSFLALILPSSVGLMETPLALLVVALGVYYLLQAKPIGCTLLGLAINVRLELCLVAILAGGVLVLQKQLKNKHILYFAIGIIPILIYDLTYFHTIVPHSIIAKSVVYSTTWFESAVSILLFSYPTIPIRSSFILSSTLFFSMLVITPIMSVRVRTGIQGQWQLIFCCWSLFVIGAYMARHAHIFDWYVPLYTVPILVAAFLCFASNGYPQKTILKGLIYLLFLTSLISLCRTLYASIYNPGLFNGFTAGSRVKSYLYVGAILYEEFPHATLLTSEIGGLGYGFQGKILDAAGLASPDSLEYHPMQVPEERANGSIGAIPPEYVKKHTPEIIVSYDYFSQALLKNDVIHLYNMVMVPAFLPEDAIWSENKTIAGSKYLRIYIRKDLIIPDRMRALGE
jgi:hypothetical protein